MATHLDLEEQEQLDRLKHFWNTYGTLITWVLLIAAAAVVAWNGWQYWQRSQAAQAATLYEELDRAAKASDAERVQRALGDLQQRFARTAYAQQAGLLAASSLNTLGKAEEARTALTWVAEKAADPGYQAVARLRLASLHMDAQAWEPALQQLGGSFPAEFQALVADRKGDVLLAQGKREEARAEYQKAWTAFGAESEYRRLVEIKLNAAGVDVKTLGADAPKS
ncbi:tetratricopeptide repeat protein [Xenophilus arseniciresistens]|uniref:Tetratricopeptide repeat protein n=1 Tax=Xenophilus arseniciresistens TaxID=1283306 RepID=A0AAE3NAH5_9BURK|nr:tetratricopeptide repeat protein [Xenophilus arseniciresistens]MDA7416129.1 tetratricopeptide repeat protein [Xenophilus arseniciresistens]